ncbi:MAG: NRDE family protein [Burkholderiales bacterium]
MCLIVFAWKTHPAFPLIVAANRDEFHARPTAAARFWDDQPGILAGRDLEGMGTWLGVTRSGRFAAVTNYRDAAPAPREAVSRGVLASRYLGSGDAPGVFASAVEAEGAVYRGFNFLAADRAELWWVSNRGGRARRIDRGIYGLSNHLLDTPWPKVTRGKQRLRQALELAPAVEPMLELLADTTAAAEGELPDTGVGAERERLMSAARIVSPAYGTRSSSALVVGADGRVRFAERTYGSDGAELDTLRYEFTLS